MLKMAVLVSCAVVLISGCSVGPQLKQQDSTFEVNNLAESLKDRRVAITGKVLENMTGLCYTLSLAKPFEDSFTKLAPQQVEWNNKNYDDLSVDYTWQCINDTFSVRSDGGHLHQLGGFLSVILSLGTLPTIPYSAYLQLDVNISQKGQQIFLGHYKVERELMANVFSNYGLTFSEDFVKTAPFVMNQFYMELDRDGALGK